MEGARGSRAVPDGRVAAQPHKLFGRVAEELWRDGRAPLPLRTAIEVVKLGRSEVFRNGLGAALRVSDSMPLEMELQ